MARIWIWFLLFVFLSPVFSLGSCRPARPKFAGDYVKIGITYRELKPLETGAWKQSGVVGNLLSGGYVLWAFSPPPSKEEVNRVPRDLVLLFNYPPSEGWGTATYYWEIRRFEKVQDGWRFADSWYDQEPGPARLELADDRSHAFLHIDLPGEGLYLLTAGDYSVEHLLWVGRSSPDF